MKKKIVIIVGIVIIVALGAYSFIKDSTEWKEYALEEINKNPVMVDNDLPPNFFDRRLVGIRDDGEKDIVVSSIREVFLGEFKDDIIDSNRWYPKEVSFPPYSPVIFFVKQMEGSAHSLGFIKFNVQTLRYKELTEIGDIFQNYYNYASIVSPDGLKIASLGYEALYLLDLESEKVRVISEAKEGEVFYIAHETPNFQWINNKVLQFPVRSEENMSAPPFEIREVLL